MMSFLLSRASQIKRLIGRLKRIKKCLGSRAEMDREKIELLRMLSHDVRQSIVQLAGLIQCQAEMNEICRRQAACLDAIQHLQIEYYLSRNSHENHAYHDPKKLTFCEYKVHSQFGEDGIVQEIFNRIGTSNRYFVEFGVETGLENNTANLLLRNWSGVWIEANAQYANAVRQGLEPLIHSGRLKLLSSIVTAENIESLLAEAAAPETFDLLSIDIDGNDYWVWKAIRKFRPRVVVIEYNATFPPPTEWIMKYNPNYWWNGTVTFGASLKSLELLGGEKGYSLVGCCFAGANAFFVRSDLVCDLFAAPFTAEHHYEPPRYYLLPRQVGHRRSYEAFLVNALSAEATQGFSRPTPSREGSAAA